MSIHNTRRGNEPRHIQSRRAEADRLVDAHKLQRADFALAHKAKWTVRTEATIDRNNVKIIARRMREQDDAALNARRARLAQLLKAEEDQQKVEIDALTENSADRAKRMIVYARQRKEDRESKRQQFADEQLKAQWREACDDLRTIGSQMAEKQTAAEIQRQMADNIRRKADADAETARYDALWEAQRQLKNRQADEEERKKQQFAEHIKHALTDQVMEARQRKIDEQRKTEEEKANFQRQLDADEAAAKAKAEADAVQRTRDKAAVAKENAEFLALRREQKQKERDAEKAILEKVLAAHRQETHQKLIDKRQMRTERLEYLEFLRQRRAEEKKLEAELERITQQALDRDNHNRDMVLLKEELARQELMKQVHAARHDQMADRKDAAARAAKELALEKTLMQRELQLYQQRQLHEAEEERQKAAQRKRDLEAQIEANQARRDILYAKAEQEHLDAKRGEAEYAAFVAAERQNPQKLMKRGDYRRKKDGYSFGLYG